MKKIFVNLKDKLNLEQNKKYAACIKELDIVVFPSMPYLFLYSDCELGCQDISEFESGSHTGNVSAEHLKDFDVKWVILNHRENKRKSNKSLIDKIELSIKNNINIIVCLDSLNDINSKILKKYPEIYIAYEPNEKLKPEEIKKVIEELRKIYKSKILYGGNINFYNIEMMKALDVDGFLIGKGALKIDELKQIIKKINK